MGPRNVAATSNEFPAVTSATKEEEDRHLLSLGTKESNNTVCVCVCEEGGTM